MKRERGRETEISKVSSLSLHLNIGQFLHVRKLHKQGKRCLKGLEETVLGGSWGMVSIPTSQSAEFNTGHGVQYSLKEFLPQYCRKSNPMLNAAMSHQKQTNKNLKSSIQYETVSKKSNGVTKKGNIFIIVQKYPVSNKVKFTIKNYQTSNKKRKYDPQ